MEPKSKLVRKMQGLTAFLAVIAAVSLSVTSCNSNNSNNSTEMTKDSTTTTMAPPPVDTAQLRADWEKFKADANEKLKESDDSISAFKKKVAKFDKKAKIKYDKDVAMLERRNDTLRTHLNEFKLESKEKWDDFKVKFDRDMNQVKNWLRDSIVVSR